MSSTSIAPCVPAGVTLCKSGIENLDELDKSVAPDLLRWLQFVDQSVAWYWGDFLLLDESKWGGMYSEALRSAGVEYQTLGNYKWCAKYWPFSRRRENLSFSHHITVLEELGTTGALADREEWLERAEENGWSVRDIREHIRKAKAVSLDDERTVPHWYSAVPRIRSEVNRFNVGDLDADQTEHAIRLFLPFREFLQRLEDRRDELK